MGKRRQETTPRKTNDMKLASTTARKRKNYEQMINKMKKNNPDVEIPFKSFEDFIEKSKDAGKKGRENSLRLEAKRRHEAANRKPKRTHEDSAE